MTLFVLMCCCFTSLQGCYWCTVTSKTDEWMNFEGSRLVVLSSWNWYGDGHWIKDNRSQMMRSKTVGWLNEWILREANKFNSSIFVLLFWLLLCFQEWSENHEARDWCPSQSHCGKLYLVFSDSTYSSPPDSWAENGAALHLVLEQRRQGVELNQFRMTCISAANEWMLL